MPTEVSVAPFRYEQQFPLSLEHPRTWAVRGPRPIHQFGPNNALGLFAANPPSVVSSSSTAPQPGQILPNGVRNPWAPYEGGSYIPSSEGVADRLAGEYAGAGTVIHAGQPVAGPRTVPPRMASGPMGGPFSNGGSVIAPAGQAPGAYRVDEGWNGSLGRAHLGHLPDATSNAGRRGSSVIGAGAGVGGNWLHAPSSWQNHARMSASLPMPMHQQRPQVPLHRGGGMQHGGTTPPVAPVQTRRASFSVSVDDCPDCLAASPPRDQGLQRVRSMSSSTSKGTRRPRRDSLLSNSSPLKVDVADIGGDSPYQPLGRRPSNSSTASSTKRHRGHAARPRRDSCSQCA